MNLKMLKSYAKHSELSLNDIIEGLNEDIQFEKAVYTLGSSDHGIVSDNIEMEWNGEYLPVFNKEHLDKLAEILNQIDDVEAKVEDLQLKIYNSASDEHEVISSKDGKYQLSGWIIYKYDKFDILLRIEYQHWEIDDVANLFLWLEANDTGNLKSSLNQDAYDHTDELRRLAYLAIHSIMEDWGLSTVEGIIEKHDILKNILDTNVLPLKL